MQSLLSEFISIFQANPLAQTIGFIAVAVNIVAFATAKDKKFLIFIAISSWIWGIHFWMLGLFSAMGVSFFDVIKNLVALKYKRSKKIMIWFLIAYSIIGIFTFELNNLISLIPIFNALISIYFIFYLKGIKLKIWFIFILALWFVYNFIWHSLGGMLSDIVLFFSGLFGLYRLLKAEKIEKLKK